MNGIKETIEQLNGVYKYASVEKMKKLCKVAGVEYREPEEVTLLVESLKGAGFVIRASRYTKPEKAVGQYLILRTLDGTFVKGYHIYINFADYTVYSELVDENLQPVPAGPGMH